jgi:hypothetical protein
MVGGRRIAVVVGAVAATLVVALAGVSTESIQQRWELYRLRRSVVSDGGIWIEFAPDPTQAEEARKPFCSARPKSFRELLHLWADCSGELAVYCGEEDLLERPATGVLAASPADGVDAELMATIFESLRFSVEKKAIARTDTVWLVGRTTLEPVR